jgi:hypothetical protein
MSLSYTTLSYSDAKVANRVGDRSRGRYATPADFPPHGGSPYRGLRARRRGFGFVHHSRAISCRAVPNPHPTIRTFCTAVQQRRLALRVALSARFAEGALCVVDDLLEDPQERGRTSWAKRRLSTLNGNPKKPYPKTLIVTPGESHPAFIKWAMAVRCCSSPPR